MNLFEYELPKEDETFTTLYKRGSLEIVRIVSASLKEEKTFCDARDEWVVLLQGEATLRMQGKLFQLKAGDILLIPANTLHTLISVSKGALWLAVHFDPKKCE
ncbi:MULTISPECIES: cupin domain-containing protein [unclassified Nitratiruptor]|uniref:cupin domain-containing protein n=1 Tax=unclassified Nitratiruptor TaxID=2624044 RepID=UPI0019154236|nr:MULTISPECIES: cupin domain-containing protein [unclassified Nitratiruptor]BCD60894.1 cupin 2 domain-containing protein [Nitratiruptor sp. YY08-10]BCD64826.1 cupin 2 domain-containing protein [Nitratiruptor sp. YY08-14]